jgi:hypothetical protein
VIDFLLRSLHPMREPVNDVLVVARVDVPYMIEPGADAGGVAGRDCGRLIKIKGSRRGSQRLPSGTTAAGSDLGMLNPARFSLQPTAQRKSSRTNPKRLSLATGLIRPTSPPSRPSFLVSNPLRMT